MKRRFSNFSTKYSQFLSEASNEEVVAISKELSDEIANQVRVVNIASLVVLSITVISLLFVVFLISVIEGPVTSLSKIVSFIRFGTLAMFCLAALLSSSALSKALRALSASPLMWRHVRETATDELVYEQSLAINRLNKLLFRSRNQLSTSAYLVVTASVVLGITYAMDLLSSMGYI